jgi:hypothetical protein
MEVTMRFVVKSRAALLFVFVFLFSVSDLFAASPDPALMKAKKEAEARLYL